MDQLHLTKKSTLKPLPIARKIPETPRPAQNPLLQKDQRRFQAAAERCQDSIRRCFPGVTDRLEAKKLSELGPVRAKDWLSKKQQQAKQGIPSSVAPGVHLWCELKSLPTDPEKAANQLRDSEKIPPLFAVFHRGINFQLGIWEPGAGEIFLDQSPRPAGVVLDQTAIGTDPMNFCMEALRKTRVWKEGSLSPHGVNSLWGTAEEMKSRANIAKECGEIYSENDHYQFENDFHHYLSRYLHNYADIAEENQRLFGVSFNPMVSYSHIPRHPIRYALGLKHQHDSAARPSYFLEQRPNGACQNSLVGVVSTILVPVSQLLRDPPDDITVLANKAQLKYLMRGMTNAEREVVWAGGVTIPGILCFRTRVEYPSFERAWTPEMGTEMLEKYGIGKELYNAIQLQLRKIDPSDPVLTSALLEFLDEHLTMHYHAKIQDKAASLISEEGGKQVFFWDEKCQKLPPRYFSSGSTGDSYLARTRAKQLGNEIARRTAVPPALRRDLSQEFESVSLENEACDVN